MVAGKNLLWLVSCQPIRAYLQADSEREGARAAYQGLSSGTCGWHAEGPSLSFRMPEAGMLGSAYPRVREKACSRQVGRQGCRFIPTHGRGERRRSGSLLRRRHRFRRSIPACVDGEGACRYRRRESHRVYPRAWANRAWRSLIDRSKGSVHAQRNFRSASSVQLRFISACVGESPRSSSTDLSPRAGGRWLCTKSRSLTDRK